MSSLEHVASGCLFPGFVGLEPPDWIRRWAGEGLGGVVLYARNVESPEQLRALTGGLRAERVDVLVALDEEGGDVTRLEASRGSSYPGNAALGAVDDVELTERVAASMAGDLLGAGVNLNLAPVADVNTNAANPVIGIRAFGFEAVLVARHTAAFVRGTQRMGVLACAKHFPGHGDTDVDSHLELPVVASVTDEALLPFRAAIAAGVGSIMTAHIRVEGLGDLPATVSSVVLRDLLRDELGFAGMVITDALEMRAISSTVGVEEGAVLALVAGADALCLGHDLDERAAKAVVAAVVDAVRSGRLSEARLQGAFERVRLASDWTSRASRGGRSDPSVGVVAARRALRSDGDAALARPPLVIELAPEPSMAAGAMPGPGEWLCAALPGSELVRLGAGRELAGQVPRGRELVVVVRNAHRHAWQRSRVEQLLDAAPDAIVVEVGLPHWRPAGAKAYLATYGAARVNLEAAAARLVEPGGAGL